MNSPFQRSSCPPSNFCVIALLAVPSRRPSNVPPCWKGGFPSEGTPPPRWSRLWSSPGLPALLSGGGSRFHSEEFFLIVRGGSRHLLIRAILVTRALDHLGNSIYVGDAPRDPPRDRSSRKPTRRHFFSGLPRALLSLNQEKRSGVETGSEHPQVPGLRDRNR